MVLQLGTDHLQYAAHRLRLYLLSRLARKLPQSGRCVQNTFGCSPHRSGNYSSPSLSSYSGVGFNRLALGVKELSQAIDFVSLLSRIFLGHWVAICSRITLSHNDIESVPFDIWLSASSPFRSGFFFLFNIRRMKDARSIW